MIGTRGRGRILATAIAGLLAFSASALATAQPGDRDPSFGTNGLTRTSIPPGFTFGYATAIGKQGRIVVGGNNAQGFAIARYLPKGDLDPALAGDGTVGTSFGSRSAYIYDVAIGKRGSIVAAGRVCTSQSVCDFGVAKYRSDGELDRSFGDGGKRIVHFPKKANSQAAAVALDSRGRVLLAGTACHTHTAGCDMALARLKSNGKRDRSFGRRGKVVTHFDTKSGRGRPSGATSMAIDGDEQIVVGGFAGKGLGGDTALARYRSNGHPVRAFGHNGRVTRNLSHLGGIWAIAVDVKDRVVVAGNDTAHGPRWGLAEFDRGGGLDRSFGRRGQVSTGFQKRASAAAIAIDSRNRIVAAGFPLFSLARYKANGKLDRSFGDGGKVTEDVGSGVALRGLAIDSRDRPVVVGSADREFAVARFLG